jgi:hypothetical protein
MKLTVEDKVRCVRLYSKYDEKPSVVQRVWRKELGTEPPSTKTIIAVNKKFDATGNVADRSRTGRPKTSHTPDKMILVEDILKRCPTKSIRAIAQDIGIAKASVHRMKKGPLVKTI